MRDSAWSGTAFGVDLEGDFSAPGIDVERAGARLGRSAALRLVPPAQLEHAFGDGGGQTLCEQDLAGTRYVIRRHDEHGFLLHNDFYGRYRVSASGARADCAPSGLPDWLWQRFLVGQVLPLTSLLNGLETLHASSVAIDGKALLFLGSSGAGKTSVALHLVGEGAVLLSDDVTAVELAAGSVLAHPGASLASVAVAESERLPPSSPARRTLGISEGEARLLIDGVGESPCEVAAVYVLTRRDDARTLSLRSPEKDPAAVLLGGTFNVYHRDGARLVTQLEVCAALAETAILRQVEAPTGIDAGTVARAVADAFHSEDAAA